MIYIVFFLLKAYCILIGFMHLVATLSCMVAFAVKVKRFFA